MSKRIKFYRTPIFKIVYLCGLAGLGSIVTSLSTVQDGSKLTAYNYLVIGLGALYQIGVTGKSLYEKLFEEDQNGKT